MGTLGKGHHEHEPALGIVLKPERWEFKGGNLTFVEKVNDLPAVDGVPGQAIRVPSDDSFRFPCLDAPDHFVENRPSGFLCGLPFNEFLHDSETFSLEVDFQFGTLPWYRQSLFLVPFARFSQICEKSYGFGVSHSRILYREVW